MVNNIAIIGSSGAIGSALVQQLSSLHPNAIIHAFSRHHSAEETDNLRCHSIDYESEGSIQQAALLASKDVPLDIVIVATGFCMTVSSNQKSALWIYQSTTSSAYFK